ncbi:MAG TPA: hypothetical protein PK906_04980 [Spirochaetota bacterium]|mgnify:CR=1 FL=1|nr:hypothetical protein [Spirochaetota bacterium]
MQNIKYHTISIIAVTLFSFVAALTINQIVKSTLIIYPPSHKKAGMTSRAGNIPFNANVGEILESGFFKISNSDDDYSTGSGQQPAEISDMKLIGTVTGPASIARAMIIKKGEKNSEIFRLWKDVYGYTLVKIESSKIYLKKDQMSYSLDLYDKKNIPSGKTIPSSRVTSGTLQKSISRAEFQQKMLNNIDNAMKGIKAGPYRVNGKIEGFHLIRVRPYNVLYDYGLRSGDVIKRINGKKIDSTEKLYNMWQGFKNEPKLIFDIERNKKIFTLDVNITD